MSQLKFYRGEYDSSIFYSTHVADYEPQFSTDVWLGRSHLLAGHVSEAVGFLEMASTQYDGSRFWNPIDAVRLHYWLGMAYEKSGWRDKAIEQYEKFLGVWKNADPGITDLEDARGRLAQLKAQVG